MGWEHDAQDKGPDKWITNPPGLLMKKAYYATSKPSKLPRKNRYILSYLYRTAVFQLGNEEFETSDEWICRLD